MDVPHRPTPTPLKVEPAGVGREGTRSAAMHYSQQQSRLDLHHEEAAGTVRVKGSGFVSRDVVEAMLDRYLDAAAEAASTSALVDLRAVAGYGEGCARVATQALSAAEQRGLRRVAVVSSSNVLRTATTVLARRSGLEVRCFPHPTAAAIWLEAGA